MPNWPITTDDVGAYIGPIADAGRLDDATKAAIAYVENRRSDLFPTGVAVDTVPDDVRLGSIIYASLLFNQRSSPTGYAAYGDGAIDVTGEPAYPRAMRLIGWRRPVVA